LLRLALHQLKCWRSCSNALFLLLESLDDGFDSRAPGLTHPVQ
jgi:hypothetical protein